MRLGIPSLRPALLASVVILCLTAPSFVTAQLPFALSSEEATSRRDALMREKLSKAVPTSLFSPVFSVAAGSESEVIVLSTVSYPVEFELIALDDASVPLPLGRFVAGPQRHVSLRLRDLMAQSSGHLSEGAIRISFMGDDETLQGWLVLQQGRQRVEMALQEPGDRSGQGLTTFWSAPSAGDPIRPKIYLLNSSSLPFTYELSGSFGRSVGKLTAGERREVAIDQPSGWLKINHDGEDGSLIAGGVLSGARHLSAMPFFTERRIADTTSWEAIRVPGASVAAASSSLRFPATLIPIEPQAPIPPGDLLRPSGRLQLFNSSSAHAKVAKIHLIDSATGNILRHIRAEVAPLEVAAVEVDIVGVRPVGELRLSVSSEKAGLLVSGYVAVSSGEVIDLAFFPRQDAHSSGTYPVPSLAENDVFTTLVNLGSEPSYVVAHFASDQGDYAYGPIEIPARTSYRFDSRSIAREGSPDVLGRRLATYATNGWVRWRVQAGSRELIGRTEVRRLGSADPVGFNCFGCCAEFPAGEVIPSYVEFVPGQSPLFQAGVTFQTCSGTEGPYLTYPHALTVPSPFSWNGVNVAASAAASETLSFESYEWTSTPTCDEVRQTVRGSGAANACKSKLRRSDSSGYWSIAATCHSQTGSNQCNLCQECCNDILAWKQCSRVGLLTANSEHQACVAGCLEHRC